jgi:CBS domain containing-hemolysin-like protein
MLESNTLGELLVFLFGTGTTIAVILQRLPGWDAVPATGKKIIVAVVGIASPVVLILLGAYIPPDVLQQIPAQIALGAVTAATSFVIHLIDEWLAGLAADAKLKVLAAKSAVSFNLIPK